MNWRNALLIAALVAGSSYYLDHWINLDVELVGPMAAIVWKGLGVGLLAVWAASKARSTDGWLIAAVLAFGALGDVLLEAMDLTTGAVAFLIGHVIAVVLYLRNRQGPYWHAVLIAAAVATLSWVLPADRAAAPGIALYALGLGAMAGTAWISRFAGNGVAMGAALFVISDILIFARLGPLAQSGAPGLLIWPTYFGGQALIAWGVVWSQEFEGLHDRI